MGNGLKTRWLVLVSSCLMVIFGSILTSSVSAHTTVKITEFPNTFFVQSAVLDRRGNFWFTHMESGFYDYVVRVTPEGVITKFFVGLERNSGGIILGSDGNLWFIDRSIFRDVERITPDGVLTSFVIPGNGQLYDVVNGADGNIWVSEGIGRNQIGRITPTGVITMFPLPAPYYSGLQSITAASDGSIWFPEPDRNIIGRLDRNGTIKEFPVWSVKALAPASDNGMWFTSAYANRIGRISSVGAVTSFSVPHIDALTADDEGGIWFIESTSVIDHMNAKGDFQELPVSSVGTIVSDRDGGLWFTEAQNMIGHMNHKGKRTELSIPGVANSITMGPDGDSLWFVEQTSNTIGRITF